MEEQCALFHIARDQERERPKTPKFAQKVFKGHMPRSSYEWDKPLKNLTP
jgi:hypothetical protein